VGRPPIGDVQAAGKRWQVLRDQPEPIPHVVTQITSGWPRAAQMHDGTSVRRWGTDATFTPSAQRLPALVRRWKPRQLAFTIDRAGTSRYSRRIPRASLQTSVPDLESDAIAVNPGVFERGYVGRNEILGPIPKKSAMTFYLASSATPRRMSDTREG
jgi:hypothetical protein